MKRLVILLGLLKVIVSLNTDNQEGIDYFANEITLKYNVIDNLKDDGYDSEVVLKNSGSEDLTGNWKLYFTHVRLTTEKNITDNNENYKLKVSHIDGSLYLIEQSNKDYKFSKNKEIKIKLESRNWMVAKTDNMPNWYVVNNNLAPRTISGTINENLEFSGKFDTEKKWKRNKNDKYNPFDSKNRYDNYINNDNKKGKLIIPTVNKMEKMNGEISLENPSWVILNKHSEFVNEASYLKDKLNLEIKDDDSGLSSYFINLKKDTPEVDGSLVKDESYNLFVHSANSTIDIISDTPAGIFYGIQSLLSLAEGHKGEMDKRGKVPVVKIMDGPRYGYRGVHIDVSRNFHDENTIKTILETMAMYKLNKFHFHLTDDEGWRLQIPDIPELTDKGAKRCHSQNFNQCVSPQFGSGPTTSSSGTGFYSVVQYQSILRYAKERHIEVIPEFDMPGHSHAAVQSLKNHPQYSLSDPNDTSQYLSVQNFKDNAINPCINSTYVFIKKVMTEVKKMHENIQPLKIFNIGGDEVAKEAWIGSKACKDKHENATNTELKKIFMEKVSEDAKAEGLDLAAWQDGLLNGKIPFPKDDLSTDKIYAYLWDNVWEFGAANLTYEFANRNYSVIISHATNLYFDHPHEPDPEERGFYWATRFTPIEKVFNFKPDNVYENIDVNRWGDKITIDQFCPCVQLKEPQNIIGMQGHVWSETVRTPSQLHSMLYPRLLALAERAWHKADWEKVNVNDRNKKMKEDWSEFAHALGNKELKRLDKMNIHYYLNVPGAILQNGKLKAKTALPGMPIIFKIDSGNWQQYGGEITVKNGKEITLETGTHHTTRKSRKTILKLPTSTSGAENIHYTIFLTISAVMTIFMFK